MALNSPVPDDFERLLLALRDDARGVAELEGAR
jgi:hypothetical protein